MLDVADDHYTDYFAQWEGSYIEKTSAVNRQRFEKGNPLKVTNAWKFWNTLRVGWWKQMQKIAFSATTANHHAQWAEYYKKRDAKKFKGTDACWMKHRELLKTYGSCTKTMGGVEKMWTKANCPKDFGNNPDEYPGQKQSIFGNIFLVMILIIQFIMMFP